MTISPVELGDHSTSGNVATLFADRAAAMSGTIAIIDRHRGRDRTTTYGELEEHGTHVAALLRRVGVNRGDVVLLGERPGLALYSTILALLRIGAVAMIVEPGAGRRGLVEACAMASPKAVFGSARALALALTIPAIRAIPVRITSSRWFPFATSLGAAAHLTPDRGVACFAADAPAILTFTSGSTGTPKGAIRTHSLLEAQHLALRAVAANEGDVDLVSLPVVVLANLAAGATSILADIDSRRLATADLNGVRGQIQRFAPTRLTVSPIVVERLAREASVTALGTLRRIVTGGGPVFPDVSALVEQLVPGVELISVYGSTEAEPIAHVTTTAATSDDRRSMDRGAGLLAGFPVPDVAVRILRDPERHVPARMTPCEFEARLANAATPGEIIVSGRHVVAGYVNGRGDAETKVHVDGAVWHRTGDAGYVDPAGRLWLLGRVAAILRDSRGVAYPFAIECAARTCIGARRMALTGAVGRRTLVVEGALAAEEQQTLLALLAWASLDEILCVERLPMDGRHASKVDYPALEKLLAAHHRDRSATPKRGR